MSLMQAIRGTQANPLTNAPFTLRGGRAGDLFTSQYHPKYYHAAKDGILYHSATQAVVTTTVGLATTYTGLVLSNPITSPVNISINKVSYMQSVIQSVQPEAFAIAVGYNAITNVTHTTPGTVRSSFIGAGVSGYGLTDVSATLPTAPTYAVFIQNTPSATTNGTGIVTDLEGVILLPPGGYACWVTPAQASVAGMWFSFTWEEYATS